MKPELSLQPEFFSFRTCSLATPRCFLPGMGQQHTGSHYKVSYMKLWNGLNLGISGMFLSGSIRLRWVSLLDFSVIFGILAQSKEIHCDTDAALILEQSFPCHFCHSSARRALTQPLIPCLGCDGPQGSEGEELEQHMNSLIPHPC